MTDIVTLTADYMEMARTLATKRAEFVAALKPKFAELYQWFFDKYPEIAALSFAGYAPYFNDGDPCIFGLHEMYAHAYDEDGNYEAETWDGYLPRYGSKEEIDEDFKKISSIHYSLGEDVITDMFGDDFHVIITREGVEVSECSHD